MTNTRPEPKLSGKGLTAALLLACFLPLSGLSIYAIIAGGAFDKPLPVEVEVTKLPLPVYGGGASLMDDVLIIKNLTDHEIPKLTMDINGQYFLHQDKPLLPKEELVVRQAAFATKSNQFWVPGRYPITEVNVTGQLPSKARGVLELQFQP